MRYRDIALFTDLDGTLFNSAREVSPENRRAIEYFTEQGGLFGISTGRAPANALEKLPALGMNTWSVVLNGAEAYHFLRRQATAQTLLPKEEAAALIRWVYETMPEVNIQVCTDDRLLLLSRPELADREFVEIHQPMSEISLREAMAYPWLKILFSASPTVLQTLQEYARANGATAAMTCVYTSAIYLEFLPPCCNKGSCLAALRADPELKGKTFIAIGDYANDIELLREADVAVAVANALPEVKAVADHIVCSNDEHALAYLIHHLIPKLEG